MPAPIQRYSDPRLYGNFLVAPFNKSYQWIRTVANPLHSEGNLAVELAVRALKILTGIIAMAISLPFALIGRSIQMIHFHSISKDSRAYPRRIAVNGMHLPFLDKCALPRKEKYHGTSSEAAKGILRWGFDPKRTGRGAKMGDAVYVSANDAVSAAYGKDQLILSLDLREGEVAYLNNDKLEKFASLAGFNFSDKKMMGSLKELFFQNGYRAIRYDLDFYGSEEAWAVYDPSCISITRIVPSAYAEPMALSCRTHAFAN